ncbi:hypothetical protein [Pseudonocardia pini]|uniref:hypothetical protein n=1 Tax=Pseudonocardia pini TaxID=2758030 RepID=UPI0015F0BFF3|nr:hypothetical protein [Pseudonocardia pini]
MSLVAVVRRYLVDRLLFGRRPRRSSYPGLPPSGPRRRGRFGLWGPVPYYSTRTRRGASVSVGGCCLPLPLFLVLGFGVGLRALWRKVRRP